MIEVKNISKRETEAPVEKQEEQKLASRIKALVKRRRLNADISVRS